MNMRNRREFDRGAPRRTFAPVNVGDELEVHIEAVGEKGDGIAKKNGFVLFVPNVSEGDDVKIKVTKVLRRVGFAEVIKKDGKSANVEEQKTENAEDEDEAQEDETQEEEGEDMESDDEDTEDFGEETDKEEA